MASQTLRSGSITFSLPKGDDKDNDTAVSVVVSTRFNNQFDLTLASRSKFANTDTWEDTGDKSYTYSLSVVGVALEQISEDVQTTITIAPNGNDTVKFGYALNLVFDDDDPNTAQVLLSQTRSNITLSQDQTTYTS